MLRFFLWERNSTVSASFSTCCFFSTKSVWSFRIQCSQSIRIFVWLFSRLLDSNRMSFCITSNQILIPIIWKGLFFCTYRISHNFLVDLPYRLFFVTVFSLLSTSLSSIVKGLSHPCTKAKDSKKVRRLFQPFHFPDSSFQQTEKFLR